MGGCSYIQEVEGINLNITILKLIISYTKETMTIVLNAQ